MQEERKKHRQQQIADLLNGERISSQGELASYLRRAGFDVTQSTVSRDLAELGIAKINGAYQLPKMSIGSAAGPVPLKMSTAGDHLIVARTPPGQASPVALAIDRENMEDVVGTVAGDDTLFIAVTGASGQQAVLRRLYERFHERSER